MAEKASVGICAHNEEETIGTLLEQILAEDVPVEQVIVVVAGDDNTREIVRDKQEKYSGIVLVDEGERRGQSAAQNEILDRATEEALFLVDGDGLIKPGSLEILWSEYSGESILYGREIPETPDTLGGRIIDEFWVLHDRLSREIPKYTTQLALLPSDLIEYIPPEIVIDDEYIGLLAKEEGYSIKYVPEAEKHHNIKGDLKSFLRHRRKNWAGMFQIQNYGWDNLQPTGAKARFYAESFMKSSVKDKLFYALLGMLEFKAFLGALIDAVRRDWPFNWER